MDILQQYLTAIVEKYSDKYDFIEEYSEIIDTILQNATTWFADAYKAQNWGAY